jgi:hypothetical protein
MRVEVLHKMSDMLLDGTVNVLSHRSKWEYSFVEQDTDVWVARAEWQKHFPKLTNLKVVMDFRGANCLQKYLKLFVNHISTSRIDIEPRKLKVDVKELECDGSFECGGCEEKIDKAIRDVVKLREG